MKHFPSAKIIRKQSWGDYHLFRFETVLPASSAETIEAKPGQFVMVRVNEGYQPLLRRPISLHNAGEDWLEIFFKVAGEGTALLAKKREGETIDILGPLGRGFDLSGEWKGKSVYLVGGGRGIAPIYFLGCTLQSLGAEVKILYGGRTEDELPIRGKFTIAGLVTVCATDDGSYGFAGFVTDLLDREIEAGRPDGLFVCGPDLMMQKCAALAAQHGLPTQISLESMMGCGFGACWGCVKRIKQAGHSNWRKICEDGPVFKAEEIIWDEA